MDKVVIGVTGIGAPLGQSIVRASLNSTRDYKLIVTDINKIDSAVFPELEFRKMPHVSSPDYIDSLIKMLNNEHINLMFFGSEREMLGVLPYRKYIEEHTNTKLAISNDNSMAIGTDKYLTIKLLEENKLLYPHTIELKGDWEHIVQFANEIGFPCIVKGRRSGTPVIVHNTDQLLYHFNTYDNAIIQEYLGEEEATEYTVGAFCTNNEGLIDLFCMRRILKYGLTWRGWYEKNTEVEYACQQAIKSLRPIGSVNIQLRYHKGNPIIHEFNVRCSSSTVFRSLSGWNEIDMAVDYFIYQKVPQIPTVNPGFGVRCFQEYWVSN